MQYRNDRNGTPLSALGYGCMRFTRKGASIDMEKTEKELLCAYENGVNYFDTAYIYPGSEAALGRIVAKNNLRDKIHIATKLPHYMIKSLGGMEKMFSEQLSRLQTDYIDYYLMHILSDINTWNKLCSLGIEKWIADKKRSGTIKNIGFSYHGGTEMFKKLIDAYDWDFCQIQYNYLDEHAQAGREGLEYAHKKGIPVIIMEPLRGGRLVDLLPESAKKLIADAGTTPAALGLGWLWDQKAVTVVLSGMNSIDMVRENCAAVCSPGSFAEDRAALVERVKKEIHEKVKVGCTGCSYCMPCPRGVDIPAAFRCYNRIYTESRSGARKEYLQCTVMKKEMGSASLCVGWGSCEKHCPQGINIRQELKNASRELETFSYKVSKLGVKLFRMW